QTHGDELHAADKQGNGEQQQRAVYRHYVHAASELLKREKAGQSQTQSGSSDAQQTKELQRTSGIIQQEFHDQQIEEFPNGAADAIVALAVFALPIGDGDFRDPRAGGAGQRGNEAVKLTIELNFLDDFAAIGLEGSTKIVQVQAGELGHHPIGS